MNVIIFGPPGAGKGTQSNNIVKKFNLYQISTGDLLRDEVKNQTDLGKDIENIIGMNASSISEVTGIPRATVIRKLRITEKKGLLHKDKQQLY